MYLLLGSPFDLCCTRVAQAMRARGCDAEIVANPLTAPARVAWQLDCAGASSRFHRASSDETASAIEGVLVRSTGWIDPAGWDAADYSYMLAETQAALLAWLWSLPCTVINRYDASLWYRPRPPLAAWRPLLERAGLRSPSMVITNVAGDTRAFADDAAQAGAPGVVYTTLTGAASYLVGTSTDWRGIGAVQQHVPVCLAFPHEEPHQATVVGDRVIWHEGARLETRRLEPALRRFARAAHLSCVNIAVADTAEGLCVVDVDHQPLLEPFTPAGQSAVTEALVDELTAFRPEAVAVECASSGASLS